MSAGAGEDESGGSDKSSIEDGGGGGESLLGSCGLAASGEDAIFQYGFPAKFPIKK